MNQTHWSNAQIIFPPSLASQGGLSKDATMARMELEHPLSTLLYAIYELVIWPFVSLWINGMSYECFVTVKILAIKSIQQPNQGNKLLRLRTFAILFSIAERVSF